MVRVDKMDTMTMYLKFVGTMALGMLGIGLLMKVLLDRLFVDWDAVEDLETYVKDAYRGRRMNHVHLTEDILMEKEKARPTELTTRMIDKRREALREMDAVEHRLHAPVEVAPAPEAASAKVWAFETEPVTVKPAAPAPVPVAAGEAGVARNPTYDDGWS